MVDVILQRMTSFLLLATLACATTVPPDPGPGPFRHDAWTAVLERFVDEDGLVDYRALARDRAEFDRYVERVEAFSPASHPDLFPSRNHELAYYVNAYNALTFKAVLARGPEKTSVWRGLVSGLNFFVLMKVEVGGRRMSLKKLEDSIIRAEYDDPRIHAALNCASIGCPRLQRHAFTGEDLDVQLDAAMREFATDPRHVRVDDGEQTVYMNKIYDWFRSDFGGDPVAYVNRFREHDDAVPSAYRVVFPRYDKGINAQ